MPTYPTPAPIDLVIAWQVGGIRLIASDRADAVVSVAPTDPQREADRRGAEQTTIEFDGTCLRITGPKPRLSIIGPTESVDLEVHLPTGSRVTVKQALGALTTRGRLGATHATCSMGPVDIDETGDLLLRAGHGGPTIGHVRGSAEITADHGAIRVGTIDGDALLKASHGAVTIDETGGDAELRLSFGDVEIARARAGVTAKTAYGAIRLGEVSAGSIDLESAMGAIVVHVREGVAAWLDLETKAREGRVRNALDRDARPAPGEPTVSVRARARMGDIVIERAR